MYEAADQIINKLLVGQLAGKVLLSETDAETIKPEGYSIVNLTQAGAAETRVLGNGTEGQRLLIVNSAYAADTVITPTALAGGDTITFNAAEDGWEGVFFGGSWHTINLYGTAAIA
jgi:hypothetical protein